jgi:hypothetical protein
MTLLIELEKKILKFIRKHKRLRIAKTISSKKKQCWSITIPDFKLYYRAIKPWYWHENSREDQWSRMEDPEVNPQSCSRVTFNKGCKSIPWGKESLFNKWC